MIVATAGHIDHGKTLLIRALTGVDTDRLPEEKRRGISIDLGFAYWKPVEGRTVGFIDVPGHERFVRNMLAGVCGIDLALLVVAADDGVMRQTIEHLQILDLLEIRDAIVVITKIDRVPPERVAEVSSQVLALLAPTALAGASLVPVSAVTGEGIDALKGRLLERLQTCLPRPRADRRFRLAIDRAFSVVGAGTVVTGTVFDGEAAIGDHLMLSPAGIGVRVRSIQVSGGARQRIAAGERAALNISGADIGVAGRGAWLIDEAVHAPTQRLDVRFRLLASESHALAHWTPVHVHLGTATSPARVATLRSRPVEPGAIASIQIVLDRPFVAFQGDRLVIRDQSARRTLGGGLVLDPFASARNRSHPARLATLEALSSQTPRQAFDALLGISGQPVDLSGYERRFNLTAEAAGAVYQRAGVALLGKERRIAIPGEAFQDLQRAIVAAVTAFHQTHPASVGLSPAALRLAVSPHFPVEGFQFLVRELVQAGELRAVAGNIARPGFDDTSNAEDQALWKKVRSAIEAGGFSPPTTAELAALLRISESRIKDLLHRKGRSGDVINVAEHHFYLRPTLAVLAATVTALAAVSPGGLFGAARFRDVAGTNRYLAIRILETFDTLGITLRIRDERKVIKDFAPILGAAQPLAIPNRTPVAGQPGRASRQKPQKPPQHDPIQDIRRHPVEHDVIILGGGPAGLAAATQLSKAGHRTLLIYSGSLGGQLPNLEWINDYPEVGQRTEGPLVAAALVSDAEANGVAMLEGNVEEIEAYSSCHAVTLAGGKTMTSSAIIVAGGLAEKKLGVPGEAEYRDKGMIHCAACDASLYSGQSVAVCGGGTSGAIEALHLARFAARVYLVERADALTAPPKLRERLLSEPRIEVRLGQRPLEVLGNGSVRALKVIEVASGEMHTLDVSGVLARVGFEPRCAYLDSLADLDQDGRIVVDEGMRTRTPGILAAGDIRSGAPRRVRAAIADAQAAAVSASALLDVNPTDR